MKKIRAKANNLTLRYQGDNAYVIKIQGLIIPIGGIKFVVYRSKIALLR